MLINRFSLDGSTLYCSQDMLWVTVILVSLCLYVLILHTPIINQFTVVFVKWWRSNEKIFDLEVPLHSNTRRVGGDNSIKERVSFASLLIFTTKRKESFSTRKSNLGVHYAKLFTIFCSLTNCLIVLQCLWWVIAWYI